VPGESGPVVARTFHADHAVGALISDPPPEDLVLVGVVTELSITH